MPHRRILGRRQENPAWQQKRQSRQVLPNCPSPPQILPLAPLLRQQVAGRACPGVGWKKGTASGHPTRAAVRAA